MSGSETLGLFLFGMFVGIALTLSLGGYAIHFYKSEIKA